MKDLLTDESTNEVNFSDAVRATMGPITVAVFRRLERGSGGPFLADEALFALSGIRRRWVLGC